ncbi:hypothetical protein AVEN_118587-1 [Araneus ventricosus]|uniref:Uncharacterized protein n=1 Tax=Araneus ventricosus TaxID=182803 RepID=A0A4Y2AWS5_ARAVE|nr:hypothetical protein AVEN_118587-1 [Araneus ventricosus]
MDNTKEIHIKHTATPRSQVVLITSVSSHADVTTSPPGGGYISLHFTTDMDRLFWNRSTSAFESRIRGSGSVFRRGVDSILRSVITARSPITNIVHKLYTSRLDPVEPEEDDEI